MKNKIVKILQESIINEMFHSISIKTKDYLIDFYQTKKRIYLTGIETWLKKGLPSSYNK